MIKKLFLTTTFIFSFCFFNFKSARLVLAACSGEGYSSCPVAEMGPKIVYTAESDFQTVREQYDDAGWSNYQIPTLILIPAQALIEDPSYVQGIIQNMANQGLVPYIRISGQLTEGENGQWVWQPIDAQTAYDAGQALNTIFSEFTGQFDGQQRVFVYNEPNLPTEMGNLDFEERVNLFAETTAAFIEGLDSEGVRNIKLYFPPMALQSGSEQQFIQQALALLQEHFGKNKFDGAALTLYGSDTQALQNLFNTVTGYFPGQFDFFISEIGPLVNGQLMLNASQAQDFADFLTQVFQLKFSNPNFLPGVSGITTSFFVDTDGDGDPDETWLVIIDKEGNVTVLKILSGENPYLSSGRAGTCPNIKEGYIKSCGEGFVLKVPELFITFVGDIARVIFPELENMPNWLRKGGSYERKNPIERLHPPQGSDIEEEAFRATFESGWRESLTGYAWYDFATGESGVTEGTPDLPETSNNAFYYAYESAHYLWGLMQPPQQSAGLGAVNTNQTLTFNGVEYPITLTQSAPAETPECTITPGVTVEHNNGNTTIHASVSINGMDGHIFYEVLVNGAKAGCGGMIGIAGDIGPHTFTAPLCTPSGVKVGDTVTVVGDNFDAGDNANCPNGHMSNLASAVVQEGSTSGGGSGAPPGPPGCAVYGVSGAPQTQPCTAGSCSLPDNIVYRVFQKIFNSLGELVEKIPIGWATNTHDVLFVPQLYYPSSLMGVYKNGTSLYNSFLPPNQANSAPEPAISEDNKHKVNLGPFDIEIGTSFNSDHVIPAVGRVKIQRDDKFLPFLEPPSQAL